MRSKLANLWENVQSSLWFVPTVALGLAVLASSLMIRVDVALMQRHSMLVPWLFSGTADAARTMLSVVAGSLITAISIVFSLTIVALVQASSQFTPRVLRQFTASRTNQVVLGTYIATFVYALLVLRTVRSTDGGDPFVPALSVTSAVILAVLCLGLLIFFIHHMSQSLQVAVIMDDVRQEVVAQIDDLYPQEIGDGIAEAPLPVAAREKLKHDGELIVVRSKQTGFVRKIDEQTLLEIPLAATQWLWIRPSIGEFVTYGNILAELDHIDDATDDVIQHIRNAFVIERERTITQDLLFGIRQLVDIALKALSPGINDVTTAEYALYHLGDIIARLAERSFPSNVRTNHNGQTPILVSRPTWDDVIDAAFSQIRHAAASDVHATQTLLHVLHDLALRLTAGPRKEAVHRQVAEIRYNVTQNSYSPSDKALLNRSIDQVEEALRAHDEPFRLFS
ncbi:MAG: DUF2254 domain-containing protein [Caldilineaceae bacterium]